MCCGGRWCGQDQQEEDRERERERGRKRKREGEDRPTLSQPSITFYHLSTSSFSFSSSFYLLLCKLFTTFLFYTLLIPSYKFLRVDTCYSSTCFEEKNNSLSFSLSSLPHSVSHLVGTHKPEGLSSSLSLFFLAFLSPPSFLPSSLFLYLSLLSRLPLSSWSLLFTKSRTNLSSSLVAYDTNTLFLKPSPCTEA